MRKDFFGLLKKKKKKKKKKVDVTLLVEHLAPDWNARVRGSPCETSPCNANGTWSIYKSL